MVSVQLEVVHRLLDPSLEHSVRSRCIDDASADRVDDLTDVALEERSSDFGSQRRVVHEITNSRGEERHEFKSLLLNRELTQSRDDVVVGGWKRPKRSQITIVRTPALPPRPRNRSTIID